MKVQNNKAQPVPGVKVEIDRNDGLGPVTYIFDENGSTAINDATLYVFGSTFKFTAPGYMVTYYTGDQLGPNSVITMEQEAGPALPLLIGAALILGFYMYNRKK